MVSFEIPLYIVFSDYSVTDIYLGRTRKMEPYFRYENEETDNSENSYRLTIGSICHSDFSRFLQLAMRAE